MTRECVVMALVAAFFAAGCAAQSRLLEQKKPTAIEQTMSQARADLNCPQVTARVISEEMVADPAPSARYGIEVLGCGKTVLYTVTCQERGLQGVHHLGAGRAIDAWTAKCREQDPA